MKIRFHFKRKFSKYFYDKKHKNKVFEDLNLCFFTFLKTAYNQKAVSKSQLPLITTLILPFQLIQIRNNCSHMLDISQHASHFKVSQDRETKTLTVLLGCQAILVIKVTIS